MPLAPVGESACCQFIALHNFLSGNGIGAALHVLDGEISAGRIVEIKLVRDAVSKVKCVLKYSLAVAGSQRFAAGIGIIGLK